MSHVFYFRDSSAAFNHKLLRQDKAKCTHHRHPTSRAANTATWDLHPDKDTHHRKDIRLLRLRATIHPHKRTVDRLLPSPDQEAVDTLRHQHKVNKLTPYPSSGSSRVEIRGSSVIKFERPVSGVRFCLSWTHTTLIQSTAIDPDK